MPIPLLSLRSSECCNSEQKRQQRDGRHARATPPSVDTAIESCSPKLRRLWTSDSLRFPRTCAADMHPSNYSHEAHRGGQVGNGFNRCDRYQDCHGNSFNGNTNYGNGPYTGRFPAPFHGSTPRFRFGSWGYGRPFRGGGPSSFRCPFQGTPPPSCAPRGRPPYSFRPQRFQSQPPYFQRASYRGRRGKFGSSPCYGDCSDSAQMGRCASPEVGSPKQTSQSDARDNIVRKNEDFAHLERNISAAGSTKNPPEICRESVAGKPKHTLLTPSEQHANGNGSPPETNRRA
ncbi:hypothetical protein MTO96_015925 [Rhipicephalus appendiculatus]